MSRFNGLKTIYLIGSWDRTKPVKIGIADDPELRVKQLQTGCPYKLDILFKFPGTTTHEAYLHKMFRKQRTFGEWFVLDETDLSIIQSAAYYSPDAWFNDILDQVTYRKK